MIIETLFQIAGSILMLAGIIHFVALYTLAEYKKTPRQLYFGVLFFGFVYSVLGHYVFQGFMLDAKIALGAQIIGLTMVSVMFKKSPIKKIDPFLIVLDVVNIPILIYIILA